MGLPEMASDVLATCVNALRAAGSSPPERAYVGVKGEPPTGETLMVWWERSQQQNPIGVRSIKTGGLSVPSVELRTRLYRTFPLMAKRKGPGQVQPASPEQLTDAAASLHADTEAIVRALWELAASGPWSDGLCRQALLTDCVPIAAPARGLAGSEFALIASLI